jgi:hypothetical protein
MLYERRVVDAVKGIVQITTQNERFYTKTVNDKITYIPSVTWICEYFPKGIAFYKWLANAKNWDEAEALKEAGGERGKYVHDAVHLLMQGKTIGYNTLVNDRELTIEEYEGVMSFVDWYEKTKPVIEKCEFTVFAPDDRYAGTLDLLCKIKGITWIIDFKTSQDIWPSYHIQLNAYKNALGIEAAKMAVLQLGYRRNKAHWKATEVEDNMALFNAVYVIWQKEAGTVSPRQIDYPLELSLNLNKEESTL